MANTVYITAGLPVSKNSSIDPSAGVNTAYITAGLPPDVLSDETTANKLQPFFPQIFKSKIFSSFMK